MLRLGGREFGEHEPVVMAVTAGDAGAVARAVAQGAAIVELDGPAALPAVRAAHPGLVVAVRAADPVAAEAACAAGADLVGGPAGGADPAFARIAARYGAGVVCAPQALEAALAAGVRADGVLLDGGAGGSREAVRGTAALAATGHAVLVGLADGELAGPAVATAAVTAWLGARVFRVRDVTVARQVLDMVASIAGHRPPAVTLRGMG
ncbi:hypothetical protein [Streptantibioticus silvisoli]|uniref:Dihydropteroate synthase n=1 Tax=Streptantibioticus silvisoli TaxID=2705255 RepID=A0ABT6VZH9_9ACTN|nr:hypothetical protein [Streptantibioticus silvisoli]MDI5963898.1 hypothetical protein [Streptantibioticus silvisoli]